MIASRFRFHGHNSLRYVYSNGRAVRSPLFTIKYTQNARRRWPRYSVVISKKVLKSAVRRNRIRRRIYEYLRIHTPELTGVYDVVVICTSAELYAMPAQELNEYLDQLCRKTDLFHYS